MTTNYPEIFARLMEPWPEDEVKKLSKGGRSFGYIRADQVMTRLDDVLGPENWWDSYERDQGGSDAVLCKLTIRLPDGELLTKSDLGAPADMPDEGDAEKSAVSDALKRAAVKFGVGRWLRGPIPAFAVEWLRANAAAPTTTPRPPAPEPAAKPPSDRRPTTGKQFFVWIQKRDEQSRGIYAHMNRWAKQRELPRRMVDWSVDAVEEAWIEANRKLEADARIAETPNGAHHHAHA